MNLILKDSYSNKNSLLLERIFKSNKAILESLTRNIPGFAIEFKKQIINCPIFYKKWNFYLIFTLKNKIWILLNLNQSFHPIL